MHGLVHIHILKVKHYALLLAEGGLITWIASISWQNVAGNIVSLCTILMGGYIMLRQMYRADRKKYEAENKDSLISQIDELNEKLLKATDLEKGRNRQVAALQRQIADQATQMRELSGLLIESNKSNSELTRQLLRHQEITREVGHRTANAVSGAVGMVQEAVSEAVEAMAPVKGDVRANRLAIEKIAEATEIPVKPPLPEEPSG